MLYYDCDESNTKWSVLDGGGGGVGAGFVDLEVGEEDVLVLEEGV